MSGVPRFPVAVVRALAASLVIVLWLAPAGLARATGADRLTAAARLHLTVTLEPRDPAALAGYANSVASPLSDVYHRYLTPAQFARRFGATPAQIATVRRSLQARGLDPGPASAGGLSISLNATAGRIERGLSVSPLRLSGPGPGRPAAAAAAASLGPGAARLVQSIVGLDSAAAPHPLFVRPSARSRAGSLSDGPHVVTGGPQPCSQASSTANGQGAHTADQIASAYGFAGLYGAGNQGAGVTVAVYELEPNAPSDIAAYQACYGTHASVSYVPVDGGAGSGPGGGEAALDIENLVGLAPAANLLVYQGPNSSSGAPGAGPYDTFSAIINQDRAQVISVSWGECESHLGAANAAAENTLFQQAAVQGQSIVAASGDSGSADCETTLLETQLAVDDPASQPLVTGVGGTTLGFTGPRRSETVWNSGGRIVAGLLASGAGGGGISNLWPMPAAQLDAAAALNVLGAGVSGPACGRPSGYCREVPDVSADADPNSGYVIYWNGPDGVAGQPAGWQAIGGTSAAVPVWAALLTLADASHACAASPLGFANPALYRAAGDAYANDFNDVVQGNNDFTGANSGRYAAGVGYDEATGLGTPNAAALAASLCAATLKLPGLRARRSTVDSALSVRLPRSDARAVTTSYRVTGLPVGLSWQPSTATITGRPRRIGTFEVTVTALDARGAVASRSFSWTIGAAPRVSEATLSGPSARPRLSFTVAAGRDAPALEQLRVTLPDRLKLASARGVTLTSPGVHRPRFSAQLAGGGIQIDLRAPLAAIRIELAYPELRAFTGRAPRERGTGGSPSQLSLRIFDAGSGTSELRTRLRRG